MGLGSKQTKLQLLKQIAGTVSMLIAGAILLEAATSPSNRALAVIAAVGAVIAISVHVHQRDSRRESRIHELLGIPERDLKRYFGLTSDQISQLIEDPVMRAQYAADLADMLKRSSTPA